MLAAPIVTCRILGLHSGHASVLVGRSVNCQTTVPSPPTTWRVLCSEPLLSNPALCHERVQEVCFGCNAVRRGCETRMRRDGTPRLARMWAWGEGDRHGACRTDTGGVGDRMFDAMFNTMMTSHLRMRLQNEDAALRNSIKLDKTLDVWRCMYEDLRRVALFADRGRLLELYECLALQFLPELLQAPSVDPARPGALDVGRQPGLVSIVDARQHPRNWHLEALDMQLHRLINSSYLRAPPVPARCGGNRSRRPRMRSMHLAHLHRSCGRHVSNGRRECIEGCAISA